MSGRWALEGIDDLEDDEIGEADLELTPFQTVEIGGGSWRLLGVVGEEMAQQNVGVEERERQLLTQPFEGLLRDGLFSDPAQLFRRERWLNTPDRAGGTCDHTLGCLQAHLVVLDHKGHPVVWSTDRPGHSETSSAA